MKPSNMFKDDKSSSRYWSKSSIVRWSRECTDSGRRLLNAKTLIRLVIFTVLFLGFSYLLISWLHPRPSPTIRSMINQRPMIDSPTRNLSITNSTMTEEPTTRLKTSTLPSTNVISRDDEQFEKSNGDVPLTKKYVSESIRQKRGPIVAWTALSVSAPRLALNFDKKRDYNAFSSSSRFFVSPPRSRESISTRHPTSRSSPSKSHQHCRPSSSTTVRPSFPCRVTPTIIIANQHRCLWCV
jgi:hypothetical protein